jgi:hypothetical protein
MPEGLEALHVTSSVDDVPLVLATVHGEVRVTLRPALPVEMTGDVSTLVYGRPGWVDVRDLYPGPTLFGFARSMCRSTLSMLETYSTFRSTRLGTAKMRRWPILRSAFMTRSSLQAG